MSNWTHITCCISVETGMLESRNTIRKTLQSFIQLGPKITGSEGPVDIFINFPTGYNAYVSHDCRHCKHGMPVELTIEPDFDCPKRGKYDCAREYQTQAVISIQGDLRDTTKKEVDREFRAFLHYISKGVMIRDYSVSIEDDVSEED